MLIINDQTSLERALAAPLDTRLKSLLWKRACELGSYGFDLAHFIVVQPGDTLEAVTEALSFSPLQNPVDGAVWPDPDFTPGWEWIEDHGGAYEAVFILDDSGFGRVLLIEAGGDCETALLRLCAQYA
jgi:hypothetical protein